MKIRIKKYFVSILALLLVLSNFSFAASYILCNMDMQMNKAGFKSCCEENTFENKNDGNEIAQGLTIDAKDNTCCKTGVRELANTNILLSFDSQVKHNLTPLAYITSIYNISFNNNFQASKFIYFGDRIPPPDIRITTSSFLI